MSLPGVFRNLRQVELAMAQLYERLADVHKDNREATRLFSRLASDERSHALEVELQARLTLEVATAAPDVASHLAGVIRMHDEVTSAIVAAPGMTLDNALALAARFEGVAAERHLRGTLADIHPDVARLVASLGRKDQDHLEELRTFASKGGIELA